MVGETRAASEMPVTFGTGVVNVGERPLGAGHAVATHLIAGVHDVTSTRFVARFTHIPSSHGTCKISDYVIMSFDIVIEQINSFHRVDLLFEHYVFTAQTVIDNYLVLPKIFLESY